MTTTTGDAQKPSALRFERAHGALLGLAIGDALGMPTQSMSPTEIAEDYGTIENFIDAGPRQRIAHGMRAGMITDDTEQALLLAQLLIDGDGHLDQHGFAQALIDWERAMTEKGSLDLLGPSTKAALQRLIDGVPASETGRYGTTNGAAMRIAPVGIATPIVDLDRFVDAVVAASAITHNTSIGISGAAAIGAAVSAGIDTGSTERAMDAALAAARIGERRGHWMAGGSIATRAEWAIKELQCTSVSDRPRLLRDLVGTSVASQESVVAALTLVAVSDDPWQTLTMAAALGGDTDTIAAMAGAVLGAVHGRAVWRADTVAAVVTVNHLDLAPIAHGLLALRAAEEQPKR